MIFGLIAAVCIALGALGLATLVWSRGGEPPYCLTLPDPDGGDES